MAISELYNVVRDPNPLGVPRLLLADLKREIAVSRMRVHRKHTPSHMVCSRSSRAQRDRHLVAADAGFAGIDALTGGVGHGDCC